MSIAKVQDGVIATTTGKNYVVPILGNACTAGNTLVAFAICASTNAPTMPAINGWITTKTGGFFSGNPHATYVPISTGSHASNPVVVQSSEIGALICLMYFQDLPAGVWGIEIDMTSTGSYKQMIAGIWEFSGMGDNLLFDWGAENNNNSLSWSVASGQTTATSTDELGLYVFGIENSSIPSVTETDFPSGQALWQTNNNSAHYTFVRGGWEVLSTSGASGKAQGSLGYSTTWTALGAGLIPLFSVTATAQTTWNTESTVVRNGATSWEVQQVLDTTETSTWVTRELVSPTVATSWETVGHLSVPEQTAWNTETTVTTTDVSKWNSLQSVSTSKAVSWNSRAGVTTSAATAWDDYAPILPAPVQQTTWNVDATVPASKATKWNTEFTLTSPPTVDIEWATPGYVNATVDTTWNDASSLSLVTTTADIEWDTEETIDATVDTTWETQCVSVTTSQDTTWNTNEAVAASSASSWESLAPVSSITLCRWQDGAHLSVPEEIAWNSDDQVTTTIRCHWSDGNAGYTTQDTAWNVRRVVKVTNEEVRWETLLARLTSRVIEWRDRERLAGGLPDVVMEWDVYRKVTTSAATSWNLTTYPVTTSVASAWNTKQAVSASSSSQWKVQASVKTSERATWNTRRTLTADVVVSSWNVRHSVSNTASVFAWKDYQRVLPQQATSWLTKQIVKPYRRIEWESDDLRNPAVQISWITYVNTVKISRDVTWDSLAQVHTHTVTEWETAFLDVSPVTASTAIAWDVTRTNNTLQPITWDILWTNIVQATVTITWDFLTPVTASAASEWITYATHHAYRGITWDTRFSTDTTKDINWRDVIDVTTSVTSTWDEQGRVTKAGKISWDDLVPRTRNEKLQWDVLIKVPVQDSTAWDLNQRLPASLVTTWNTAASTEAIKRVKWDTRLLVQSIQETTAAVDGGISGPISRPLDGLTVTGEVAEIPGDEFVWETRARVTTSMTSSWLVMRHVWTNVRCEWVYIQGLYRIVGIEWDTLASPIPGDATADIQWNVGRTYQLNIRDAGSDAKISAT